jgi:hypothetical protein
VLALEDLEVEIHILDLVSAEMLRADGVARDDGMCHGAYERKA